MYHCTIRRTRGKQSPGGHSNSSAVPLTGSCMTLTWVLETPGSHVVARNWRWFLGPCRCKAAGSGMARVENMLSLCGERDWEITARGSHLTQSHSVLAEGASKPTYEALHQRRTPASSGESRRSQKALKLGTFTLNSGDTYILPNKQKDSFSKHTCYNISKWFSKILPYHAKQLMLPLATQEWFTQNSKDKILKRALVFPMCNCDWVSKCQWYILILFFLLTYLFRSGD